MLRHNGRGTALTSTPTAGARRTARAGARGRPAATSHAQIEEAAFRLFAEQGFASTTIEAIAHEVGVGRRTIFRYYPSKADIPWGQFADSLDGFASLLDQVPQQVPLHEAVHRGVLAFNDFPPGARPSHRDRMRLLMTTPELQAHSVHQYSAWRAVIARYVARRCALPERDRLPQLTGQVSLAIALTAYEQWLADEHAELLPLIDAAMVDLRQYLA